MRLRRCQYYAARSCSIIYLLGCYFCSSTSSIPCIWFWFIRYRADFFGHFFIVWSQFEGVLNVFVVAYHDLPYFDTKEKKWKEVRLPAWLAAQKSVVRDSSLYSKMACCYRQQVPVWRWISSSIKACDVPVAIFSVTFPANRVSPYIHPNFFSCP